MSDANFETILAGQLRQYAEGGVRSIDRYVVAEGAIAAGRSSSRRRLSLGLARGAVAPVLIGLLLLGLIAAALIAGLGRGHEDRTHLVIAVTGNPLAGQPAGRPVIDVACLSLDELDINRPISHRALGCSDRLLVSPDGTRTAEAGPDGVVTTDLRTGHRTPIADTSGASPNAWSPGGRWLQWVTCASETEPCKVTVGPPDGASRNDLPNSIVGGYNGSVRWSADDRRLLIRDANGVLVGNGDGSQLVSAEPDQEPWAWSPDGGQLAYGAGTDVFAGGGSRAFDVYVSVSDGTSPRNMTKFDSETALGASWSPDGRTLVAVSSTPRLAGASPADQAELWVVDIGGGPKRVDLAGRLVASPGRDWATAITWSPDGSAFAVEADSGESAGPIDLFVVPADGSGAVVIHDARKPAWSSDGSSLAIVGGSGAASTIDVLRANGSNRRSVGTVPNELLSQLLWAR
jgi:Tol biopolymer transport system component